MIRCAVFDFDGTLVDSNQIKRSAFYDTVQGIPGGSDELDKLFSGEDPGDRYAIFEKLARALGLDGEGVAMKLSAQYTALCSDRIAVCPEIPGTIETLSELVESGCKLYVNSATPEVDLVQVVKRRGWEVYFNGIYGGPTTKAANLQKIIDQEKVVPKRVLMVGDGLADYESSQETDCHFVAIGREDWQRDKADLVSIFDLWDLTQKIAEIEAV